MQQAADVLILAEERSERAIAASEQYRETVAKLTSENVIQASHYKQCQATLAALTSERDALQVELNHKRGPWYEEVTF